MPKGRFKSLSEFQSQILAPHNEKGIHFYSRFESGNLLRAIQVDVKPDLSFTGIPIVTKKPISQEFDLYLEPDTFTDSHMHWYNFQIFTYKLPPGTKIRLNIRNLFRSKSLYTDGMLPRIKYLSGGHTERQWHINPKVTKDIKFYPTIQNQ